MLENRIFQLYSFSSILGWKEKRGLSTILGYRRINCHDKENLIRIFKRRHAKPLSRSGLLLGTPKRTGRDPGSLPYLSSAVSSVDYSEVRFLDPLPKRQCQQIGVEICKVDYQEGGGTSK